MDNGRFLLWVQPNAAYGLPVSCIARPACRMLSASDLIESMTPGKNGVIMASMALSGRDVTDLAMAMLFVVPRHELPHPRSGIGQVGKAGHREGGMVFAGTEQGLRVGVIVGDAGSAVRRCDAELFKFGMDGRTLHRSAVIAMQDQRPVPTLLTQYRSLNDLSAVGHVLGLKDFIAHNLAAVDINNQVQVKELATHQGRQIGHVPTPHSVGVVGTMTARRSFVSGRGLASTTTLFSRRVQDAVEGRF